MPTYNQEQILTAYRRFLAKRELGDSVFHWSGSRNSIDMYDVADMTVQLEMWIEENQTGYQLKADIENNKTIQIDGKTWYIAVFKRGLDEGLSKKEEEEMNTMCMASMALFGIMVNGFIYAFELEALRDWSVKCLNENKLYSKQSEDNDSSDDDYTEELEPIVPKHYEFESRIYDLETKLSAAQETIFQLLGGLFNQETQKGFLDAHLRFLYTGRALTDEEIEESLWPTTRQGDENEARIQQLEENIDILVKRLKQGKPLHRFYRKFQKK
jgi:uncharacterized coiled-coil protein SlyX